MKLSRTYVSSKFKNIRTVCSGALVSVRFGSVTVQGIKTSLEQEESIHSQGAKQSARGAVRLAVDELPSVHPKAGTAIQIQEEPGGKWFKRMIVAANYDQLRASLRIDYGEQYG